MEEKYLNDLKEIKEMMNRSSRFISLSGISGIATGVIALAGALAAYWFIFRNISTPGYYQLDMPIEVSLRILFVALGTLLLGFTAGIYFTTRETMKRKLPVWDYQTKRLLINLAIPLLTGGIVCLIFLFNGFPVLLAPMTLIFYGLALVNAGKYTLNEVRSLGLIEIFLGLLAMQWTDYGLLFWAFGFGVLHIVYGLIIQRKYKP